MVVKTMHQGKFPEQTVNYMYGPVNMKDKLFHLLQRLQKYENNRNVLDPQPVHATTIHKSILEKVDAHMFNMERDLETRVIVLNEDMILAIIE